MKQQASAEPRIGVVGMAYGGYHLGEEMGPAKLKEMLASLAVQPCRAVPARRFVLSESDARETGRDLAGEQVDCILAVVTTFVPDYFLVELLDQCDVPVFVWAVERELRCISLVCGPLITATLHNLRKRYGLSGADVGDPATMRDLIDFARAAMLVRVLRTMRVGFCGGRCPIMLSLSTDEYALKRLLGTTVVSLPIEEFHDRAREAADDDVAACWQQIKTGVGEVTAADADGLLAARYYLAAHGLAEKHQLDALSLNCFPHLKSRACLAVAMLNDEGVAAACEGDLHSTILMHLLHRLTGRPAFNGDWLRMYPEADDVLFSHCGAGALSLAAGPREVCLRCSIETRDGLAVCYPTKMTGPVTLVNLMMGRGDLRLAVLEGEGVETGIEYEGTPLRVHFAESVHGILRGISRHGAGHHWSGASGHFGREFELLCEWLGITFHRVTH